MKKLNQLKLNQSKPVTVISRIAALFIFSICNWAAFAQQQLYTNSNQSITSQIDTIAKIQHRVNPIDTTEQESIEGVLVKTQGGPNGQINQINFSLNAYIIKSILTTENLGRDIPILLQSLPGIISTSDAGNGIGYTGIRVRGSDASRTNITINGVPINDAESQGSYWVNMPDLSSSTQSITITRGSGFSTNGGGAFGATVAISTQFDQPNAYFEFTPSIGSFNTQKITLKGGSTPIKFGKNKSHRIQLNGRISQILSAGFIDRSNSNLKSYLGSASYQYRKTQLKFLTFGGHEQTHQAWWGVPIEKYNMGNSNADSNTYKLLVDHYWRNAGFSGATYRNAIDSANLFNSKPNTYNYYTYKGEIDDYQQQHQHLYFTQDLNKNNKLALTLYHTFGTGFFEQFRYGDSFSKYGIAPIRTAADTNVTILISAADLIRQRWLKNNLFGANANYIHHSPKADWLIGGGYNRYLGHHFGQVTQILALSNPVLKNPIEYYRGRGNKTDANFYVKLNHKLGKIQNTPNGSFSKSEIFADIQLRRVIHIGDGSNNDLTPIQFKGDFLFFNPKIGYNYHPNNVHNFNIFIGMAHKEPARTDFTDNPIAKIPKPEQMLDFEFTHTLQMDIKSAKSNAKITSIPKPYQLSLNTTIYYMQYKDQLVLTGALNDVGSALRINVPKSFRRGIECSMNLPVFQSASNATKIVRFNIISNLALSQNVIPLSPVSWFDYGSGIAVDTLYKNAPIAYSPNLVAASGFNATINGLTMIWLTKFVGRQYLDNTGDISRSLSPYKFSEITLQYQLKLHRQGRIDFRLQLLNVFGNRYTSNGYAYGYMNGSRNIIQEVFVFPQAPRNILWGLSYRWN